MARDWTNHLQSFSSSQRSAVQQFIAFTQCSERTAAKFLKASSWNVEAAADSYFNSSTTQIRDHSNPSSASCIRTELSRIFDGFLDLEDGPDTMGVTGSMNFLQSIDVGLEEPTVLVIAELLKAPTMGEFSREGFVEGWANLGCKSLDQMRVRVPGFRACLEEDETAFKRVYKFTYAFARTPGQKSLPQETAAEYWKLLLGKRFAHLPAWIEFLNKEYQKSITKDTWNCMYDFVQLAQKDPRFDTYDMDGAWPSILDDFVRYWKKQNAC